MSTENLPAMTDHFKNPLMNHPRLLGALFVMLLILTNAQITAANGAVTANGP